MSHNKGKTKSPLGHSHAWVQRVCPCGAGFRTQVKTVNRGGGLYCSKKCNPSYAPKSEPSSKYRRYNLKSKYGMSISEYDAMLAAQGGVCAICAEQPRGVGRFGRLAVDHDHETGAIRKLLCSSCNRALGWFRDRADLLDRAAAYLRHHATGKGNASKPEMMAAIRAKGHPVTDENEADAVAVLLTAQEGGR